LIENFFINKFKGGDNEEDKLEGEQTNGEANKAPSFWIVRK